LLRAPDSAAYNVGGDEAVTIAELARRVMQLAGADKDVRVMTPRDPLKAAERYVPDIQKAEHELGLKTWIPLDEAIHRTLQWCKQMPHCQDGVN
jgi:nucleoside-diphosphate-sugar epimerase